RPLSTTARPHPPLTTEPVRGLRPRAPGPPSQIRLIFPAGRAKGIPRTSPAGKGQASLRSVATRPLATGREPRSGHDRPTEKINHPQWSPHRPTPPDHEQAHG